MAGIPWTDSEEKALRDALASQGRWTQGAYAAFLASDRTLNARRSFEGCRNKLKRASSKRGAGVEFTETTNVAEARSTSEQIKTLAQLIEACKVDLSIWKVVDWAVRAYDGWRADTDKDLVFDEGRITGHVRSRGITTRTLWSIFARFVRRNPIPVEPTFQPISCSIEYPSPRKPKRGSVIRALILGDAHIGFKKDLKDAKLYPFHDRKALDVAVQVAELYQPNLIGVIGDWLDMSRWTKKFASDPEFYWATQPAILEGHWWLRRLRESCPDTRIVYLEGNHEKRMRSYIRDHMMEAYHLHGVSDQFPVLGLPHLLNLSKLQIDWAGGYPEDAVYYPAPWLCWEHGNVARVPGITAKAMIEHVVSWRVFGHVHRREVVSRTFEKGRNISGVNFGCLCHVDGRVPGSSLKSQWQQGFGIMEFAESLPSPSIEMITVVDGKATWRGAEFGGESNVRALEESFADWHW